ncbi:hypothetical protein [Methylobacterium fujisawaense]|uniref:hypothetical protein n=1 Tax=Methylobacterium fujisawaense TaxID=107400 RepID=UPI00313E9A1D
MMPHVWIAAFAGVSAVGVALGLTATVAKADPYIVGDKPVVRLIVEENGAQKFALRCPNGVFTIRHNGKGADTAAAVFRGEAKDGDLTSSGVITCEPSKADR